MRNYFKSNLGVNGNGGIDRKTMSKIYEKRNMPMTEKYYSMEFLRKVQKWEEAYKKWSRELNTVDTQMQQYILEYLEKEETGVQEMTEEIIARLPGSSTKRMLIDKVENLEMQERHGFAEEKNSSVPVVKKINTYIKGNSVFFLIVDGTTKYLCDMFHVQLVVFNKCCIGLHARTSITGKSYGVQTNHWVSASKFFSI